MMPIKNSRGQTVGMIHAGEYVTDRDCKKGQIFRAPRFGNGIAIDESIIKRLIENKVNAARVRVTNFESEPFWAVTELKNFVDAGIRVNFDKRNEAGQNFTGYGAQLVLPMSYFRKVHGWQTKLEKFT